MFALNIVFIRDQHKLEFSNSFRLDFRVALQFLEYSREEKELCSASVSNPNEDMKMEISVLEQEINMFRCCCDSVRMRAQADKLFDAQINEAERINMTMMWNILDMYKEAVLLTREKDIENEAIAHSGIGRLYV